MAISCTVCFAGLVCRFEDFGSSTFCDSWQWKLDPYLMSGNTEKSAILFRNPAFDVPSKHIANWQTVSEVQDGFFLRQISRSESGDTLWRCIRRKNEEVLLTYQLNPKWDQIELLKDATKSGGQMAFEYLTHLFPACALKNNLLTFHGTLVEYKGKGFILLADSGVGKTTHARLWRDTRHALILNGDKSSIRKTDGIWMGYGLPWSGTSGEQINRSAPIQALVCLERGAKNSVRQMNPSEVLATLLTHLQFPSWDRNSVEKALNLLEDLISTIPILNLTCRPDPDSVDVLARVLEEL